MLEDWKKWSTRSSESIILIVTQNSISETSGERIVETFWSVVSDSLRETL